MPPFPKLLRTAAGSKSNDLVADDCDPGIHKTPSSFMSQLPLVRRKEAMEWRVRKLTAVSVLSRRLPVLLCRLLADKRSDKRIDKLEREKAKLEKELRAAGEETGERVWPLPLLDEHRDQMKGHIADLRNMNSVISSRSAQEKSISKSGGFFL